MLPQLFQIILNYLSIYLAYLSIDLSSSIFSVNLSIDLFHSLSSIP